MDHAVLGTSAPALELILDPGEAVLVPPARIAWMSQDVAIEAGVSTLVRLRAGDQPVLACLATNGHAEIVTCSPMETAGLVVDEDYFLCAGPGAVVEPFEGLFERGIAIGGKGVVFLCAGGTRREYSLDPGESLVVEQAHVVALDHRIQVSEAGGTRVSLAGPGRVWVQTARLPAIEHGAPVTPMEPAPAQPPAARMTLMDLPIVSPEELRAPNEPAAGGLFAAASFFDEGAVPASTELPGLTPWQPTVEPEPGPTVWELVAQAEEPEAPSWQPPDPTAGPPEAPGPHLETATTAPEPAALAATPTPASADDLIAARLERLGVTRVSATASEPAVDLASAVGAPASPPAPAAPEPEQKASDATPALTALATSSPTAAEAEPALDPGDRQSEMDPIFMLRQSRVMQIVKEEEDDPPPVSPTAGRLGFLKRLFRRK